MNEKKANRKKAWLLNVVNSVLCCSLAATGAVAQTGFSPPQNLTNTLSDSSSPQIATNGSYAYLVWREASTASSQDGEIHFARSLDAGKSFGLAANLSNTFENSFSPQIAASGSDVYVIWNEPNVVYLRHSMDGGETFGQVQDLTTPFGILTTGASSIAASGDAVWIIWSRLGEIFVSRSTDKGTNFTTGQNISNTPTGSIAPQIAVSGSNVYAAWVETLGPNSEIYFSQSIDSGMNFAPATNISVSSGSSSPVTLEAEDANVWIAWSDRTTGNNEILFARSADLPANFEASQNLTNNLSQSLDPWLKAKGGKVYLARADLPADNSTGGVNEVYLMISHDSGLTFDSSQNISNTPTMSSASARIGVTDSVVCVVWTDAVPGGSRDIYSTYLETVVSDPPPAMLSVLPDSARQGDVVEVIIRGSHFKEGAQVSCGGAGITVNSTHFNSDAEVTAQFTVSPNADLGPRDLSLINPDNKSTTLPASFTITSASALTLIEITRADILQGMDTWKPNGSNSGYNSLLAHLDNAERALLQQPPDLARAVNQMDAFYIKIGNMCKGKKPELSASLYSTLYHDYTAIMNSLGATPKPAH